MFDPTSSSFRLKVQLARVNKAKDESKEKAKKDSTQSSDGILRKGVC